MSSVITPGGWPDMGDIPSYCERSGLDMSSCEQSRESFIVARAINAAIAEFDRRTDWQPFLAAADTARLFDPPTETRFIPLTGLASLTSLFTGVGFDGNGGTALVQNQGFRLLPVDAPAKGRPYEVLEVLSGGYPGGVGLTGFGYSGLGPYGRAQSVKIVGAWGYCKAIPWDVSEAVIARALSRIMRLAGARTSGLIKSVQVNGDIVQFQPAPFQALMQSLDDEFEAAVGLHKREPLYL